MVPRTKSRDRGMVRWLVIGAWNNIGGSRRAWGMTRQLGRGAGDDIGSTIRDSESRQVWEELKTKLKF